MHTREKILTELRSLEEALDADIITPASLAQAYFLQHHPKKKKVNEADEYLILHAATDLARRILSVKHGVKATIEDQDILPDMFSGTLQARYPLPDGKGYRRRENLSFDEATWVLAQMRKMRDGLDEHIDAFKAWNDARKIAS